jgi:metallo-beta-lactamase class B
MVVLALSLCAAGCFDQITTSDGPIDRSDLPIKVTKVRGSVHLVEDYNFWKTNSVIFAHKEGIVFLDGSWSIKSARQILWKGAVRSEADYLGVVVTGFPLYRTGGLWAFRQRQVPIYMHNLTPRLLRAGWISMQKEMSGSFSAWRSTPPQAPDYVFSRDLKFMGGRVVVLYPGQAHTPDNCVVYFPEEKILYGGSLIADPPFFLKYSRPEKYKAVLEKIRSLDFNLVIAGHGKALHRRSILDRLEKIMARRALEKPVQPSPADDPGRKSTPEAPSP